MNADYTDYRGFIFIKRFIRANPPNPCLSVSHSFIFCVFCAFSWLLLLNSFEIFGRVDINGGFGKGNELGEIEMFQN